jgi:predicted transcriptional regulator
VIQQVNMLMDGLKRGISQVEVMMGKSVVGDVNEKREKKRIVSLQCYCLQGRVALLPPP